MSVKKKETELSFESGVARLEELIGKLESGEPNLDESLALFEEGIGLSRQLNRKLDEAEKKLDLLIKDENGEKQSRDFSLEPEES